MKAICPNCDNIWAVPAGYAGMSIACPKCKQPVTAPKTIIPIATIVLTSFVALCIGLGIGFGCGALLTRPKREETQAAIAKVQAEADKLIAVERSKTKKAKEENARLTKEPSAKRPRSSSGKRNKPTQNHSPIPQIGTAKRLEYEVKKTLRSSNRDVPKVYDIQFANKSVQVSFSVNDNLTKGLIKFGTQMDVIDVLKAVNSSGYDYSDIVVRGTFPLGDKFGNWKESMVIHAVYTIDTIKRINWHGILPEDVYDIAQSAWIHPDFK